MARPTLAKSASVLRVYDVTHLQPGQVVYERILFALQTAVQKNLHVVFVADHKQLHCSLGDDAISRSPRFKVEFANLAVRVVPLSRANSPKVLSRWR